MITCREIEAHLEAYALGALDNVEQQQVEQHLSSCVSCKHLLEQYDDVVALLPATLAMVSPWEVPPTLEGRVMASLDLVSPSDDRLTTELSPLIPSSRWQRLKSRWTQTPHRRWQITTVAFACLFIIAGIWLTQLNARYQTAQAVIAIREEHLQDQSELIKAYIASESALSTTIDDQNADLLDNKTTIDQQLLTIETQATTIADQASTIDTQMQSLASQAVSVGDLAEEVEQQDLLLVGQRESLSEQTAMLQFITGNNTLRLGLYPTAENSSASGRAYMQPDQRNAVFLVLDMPQPSAGETYHIWITTPDETFLAGTIEVDENGFGKLITDMKRVNIDYQTIDLALQPLGSQQIGEPILSWDLGYGY